MGALVDLRETALQAVPATGAPTGLGENAAVAYEHTLRTETTLAERLQTITLYDAYIEEIAAAGGPRLPNPITEIDPYVAELAPEFPSTTPDLMADPDSPGLRAGREAAFREQMFFQWAAEARKPDSTWALLDPETLRQRLPGQVAAESAAAGDVFRRQTTLGAVGMFGGTMAGATVDPPVLAATLLTAPVAAETTLLRAMAMEAALAGGTELLVQPEIQRQQAVFGREAGLAQGAQNVAVAAAGGAVFGGVTRGLALGFRRLLEGAERLSLNRSGVLAREQVAAEVATRDALASVAGPELDNRQTLAAAEEIVTTQGRMPTEKEINGAASSVWSSVRALVRSDPRWAVEGPGGQRWLAYDIGSPDFPSVDAVPSFSDAALPVRIPYKSVKHLDDPAHAEQAVRYGFASGFELLDRVLHGWTEIYRGTGDSADRIILGYPIEGDARVVAVVELRRERVNAGADFWSVVTSGVRRAEQLGEAPLVQRARTPHGRPEAASPFLRRLDAFAGSRRGFAEAGGTSNTGNMGAGSPEINASAATRPAMREALGEIFDGLPESGVTVSAGLDAFEMDRLLFLMRNPDRVPSAPMSLTQFVRAQGGVRTRTGAGVRTVGSDDLEARIGRGRFLTLANNKTGLDLDELALRATEAGYFPNRRMRRQDDLSPDLAGEGRATLNELVDALAEDAGGMRRIIPDDERAVADELAQLDGLKEEFANLGIDPLRMNDAEINARLTAASMGFEAMARGPYAGTPRTAADIEAEAAAMIEAGAGPADVNGPDLQDAIEADLLARLGDDPEAEVIVDIEIGADGTMTPVVGRLGDLMERIEADRRFIAEFNACAGRGAA